MLHEIGKELQVQLRAKGCDLPVVDREFRETGTSSRERIVIEHDGEDSFQPPKASKPNPSQFCIRRIGAKLTIYAQSTKSKAQEYEHRRRAEAILDCVLTSMDKVAADRRNDWSPTGGRFVTPEYAEGTERFGGVAYELSFTFDRGVSRTTFKGEAAEEVALGTDVDVTRVTKVRLNGGAEETI